ncbi:hypothetical protein KJ865_12060, partial [Myxococcota bacterium]|nr:hypothetical protein [Myxococcota bacterium]
VDRLRDKGIRVGGMEREAQCSLMLYALDLTETDPVAFGLPHGFFFRYGEGGVQPFRFRLGENDLCGLEECVMEVFEGSGLARVASEACAPGEFIELATKVFHLNDSMVEVLKKELAGRKLCDLRLRREEVLSEDEEVLLHEISVLHENWSCDRQSFGTYAVYDRSSCADLPLLPNQDPLGNGSALPLTQYDPGQLLDAGVMYYSFERCRLTDHIFNTLFELQDVLGWGKPERRPRWEYGVNDVSVYKRLSAGRLPEIGWLREPLLRQTLQEVRPESIGDLADVIALCFFKNACLGNDEEYIACRNGDEDAPRLPVLAVESLRSPRCALIYREQVVEILCGSVGLSAARAVEFVNSAFHAKRERLAAFGDVILSACRERGISPAEAIELNQYLRRHGTFLFSRAHAVSCALLIYQITYLGVHVPATLAGVLALWMESQEDEEEDSPIFP